MNEQKVIKFKKVLSKLKKTECVRVFLDGQAITNVITVSAVKKTPNYDFIKNYGVTQIIEAPAGFGGKILKNIHISSNI